MTCQTKLGPGETTLDAWDRVTSYRVRITPSESAPGYLTLEVTCPRCGGPWFTLIKLGDTIDLRQTCPRCP